ncbi:hypothetical protein PFISCL1PPCAC_21501, partial [Pristionchus fissidentatus]
FPLLDLPNQVIIKILRYIPNRELKALRVNKRIDILDPKMPELIDFEITTTAECSEFKCDRYSPSLIRSSMEGIVERFKKITEEADNCGTGKLTFTRANPFHVELVEEMAFVRFAKLEITCSYKDGQRHSTLSKFITNHFVEFLVEGKGEVLLNVICREVNAKKLFKDLPKMMRHPRHRISKLRIHIPDSAVPVLLKSFHVVMQNNGEPKATSRSVEVINDDGIVRIYTAGNPPVDVYVDHSVEGATITGEDTRVEMEGGEESDDEDYDDDLCYY